jgi:hypothetical protein
MQSALFAVVDELQSLAGAAQGSRHPGPRAGGALNALMARSRTPGMGTRETLARRAVPQSASPDGLADRRLRRPAGPGCPSACPGTAARRAAPAAGGAGA